MEREIKLIFLFTFLLFPAFLLAQQEVQVRGAVIEARTNEPLPGVSILIENFTRDVSIFGANSRDIETSNQRKCLMIKYAILNYKLN
ncbi:MAG: hypothetical protein VB074_13440 [Proteiniphilum sp.]|jgi:hypothetical protein|uniref:hypothetical protein n=1 Tax=Proteiniphilum sp. TaxID=1926877 RepID=UPI002B1F6A1F|nr:hypothetical protein [Proteiniphilum sp.]MEA5129179.1 hypothetical protein [Proteiniphilum sp.]